jgi:FtsH-binding integral membrane protein
MARTLNTTAQTAVAQHLNQVFSYMAAGVGLSGVVAYFVNSSPTLLNIALKGNLIFLLVWMGFGFFMHRVVFSLQPAAALGVFAGFSALTGFALSPLVLAYTGASVATAFFVAAAMFAGASAYGYFSQKSLSSWGTFLILCVWGLLAAVVVNLVLVLFGVSVPGLSFAISLIAVPLFAGLTAWEVNTMKETFLSYGGNELTRSRLAILSATSLYMNFITMFIHLLNLIGERR